MKTQQQDIRERTFYFALETIRICRKITKQEQEYMLTKQLTRSSTSVGANVREARNAESKADFIHKLSIAQKECDESLYWLELMIEFIEGDTTALRALHSEASELLKIVRTIVLKTKANANWTKR
jgi:four helix bundle protein